MNNTRINQFHLFGGVPWMVVYICEAALILSGNFITVYIFWSIRKRLKRTSYLLINLAVADILVGTAVTFWLWDFIAAMMGKHLSYDVGKTLIIFDVIGIITSLLSLALISLERMFAILWPFQHRMLRQWHYLVSIGSVWVLAFLNGIVNINFDDGYSILTAITPIASVVVITAAYLAIWFSTRRNKLPGNTSRTREHNKKLAKTLFIVTALSIFTCLPSGITLTLSDYELNFHSFGFQIAIVASYANSFLNPVVYCLKMPEFKQSLKKLLCRCSRKRLSLNENPDGFTDGVSLKSMKSI